MSVRGWIPTPRSPPVIVDHGAAAPGADAPWVTGARRRRRCPLDGGTGARAVARVVARGVACTLRVVKGRVDDAVLAAAERADLLVLGAGGHARSGPAALGETARAATARARSPVLLLPRRACLHECILAIDDGSAAAERAVAIARRIAAHPGEPTVLRAGPGGGLVALDTVVRRRSALVILPAPVIAQLAGVVERLLALGMPVLVVR